MSKTAIGGEIKKVTFTMKGGKKVDLDVDNMFCVMEMGHDEVAQKYGNIIHDMRDNGRRKITLTFETDPGLDLDGIQDAFGYKTKARK